MSQKNQSNCKNEHQENCQKSFQNDFQQSCIELLCELIKKPSITPQECGIYQIIESKLNEVGGFRFLHFDKGGVKNLFAYKVLGKKSSAKGDLSADSNTNLSAKSSTISSDSIKHFCFMGHIDVVPAGENWSVKPFGAVVREGKIYGRGAQDMKAGVVAFVSAVVDFAKEIEASKIKARGVGEASKAMDISEVKSQNDLPILSILLTSDEEGEGIYGTRYVLSELQELDLLPTHAIVAEPTCDEEFGDMIKVGRRGSINGSLKIMGKQGHAAYPQKCLNPIEALSVALALIAGVKLDEGNEYFSPSTLVATDIRGGLEVCNVTPSDVTLRFNLRNSTLFGLDDLEVYFGRIVEMIERKVEGVKCELSLSQSSKPFLSNANSTFIKSLAKSVKKITHITPTLGTGGGTSDARFAKEFGIEVAEFGVKNDKIHSIDECVDIAQVVGLYEVFLDFLKNEIA